MAKMTLQEETEELMKKPVVRRYVAMHGMTHAARRLFYDMEEHRGYDEEQGNRVAMVARECCCERRGTYTALQDIRSAFKRTKEVENGK